jgi:hypothetical protein
MDLNTVLTRKCNSRKKTFSALGTAAAMGGAASSVNPAAALCGPGRPFFTRSPGSAISSAVPTNPCAPRAVANPWNPGAVKNLRRAKNPPAMENPSAEVDLWSPIPSKAISLATNLWPATHRGSVGAFGELVVEFLPKMPAPSFETAGQ